MGADAASLAESIVQNIASGFLPCCFEDRIVGAKCPAVVALKTGPAGQTSEGFFSGKIFGKALQLIRPGKGFPGQGRLFHGSHRFKVMKVQLLERDWFWRLQNGRKESL